MADQNTTVAQLPAGYATLAGVIYAVAATSPKGWNYCVWTRIAACLTEDNPTNNITVRTASQRQQKGVVELDRVEVCRRLSSQITKDARKLRKLPSFSDAEALTEEEEGFTKKVALLHILCSYPEGQAFELQSGNTQGDLESAQGAENVSPTTSHTPDTTTKIPLAKTTSLLSQYNPETFADITVHVRGVQSVDGEIQVKGLTTTEAGKILKQLILEQEIRDNAQGWTDSMLSGSLVQHSYDRQFRSPVFVQMAAPLERLVIEVVYKAIEILFACGAILGSSGGAWLGLTLASMFPQRISAGLSSSAYGQRLSRNEVATLSSVHLWRSAGTVWSDCGSNSYELLPCGHLADKWRDAIGYTLQYAILFVIQLYKLKLRASLEFGQYNITRDAIRYILLVIQFFVFLLYFFVIRRRQVTARQASSQPHQKPNASKSRQDIIAGVVYSIAQCAGITTVVLGQKEFLKPIWKFYLTSQIIDPVVAVGSVAVMTLGQQRGMKVSAEKWVLLWCLGACSVIW